MEQVWGRAGNGPWWVRACGVLGASGLGRAAGLSPHFAADAAMLGGEPGGGRRVPVRIVVARTEPGLVPLLTGVRIADSPFATDLLPVPVVHCAVDRPELRLPPGQAAALDRLARLLITHRTQPPQAVLHAAPRTAAWLRIRVSQAPAGPLFGTGCAGTDAVARALRRCHDLTAAAPVSPTLDAAVAALLREHAVISAQMRAAPLPWPAPTAPADAGEPQDRRRPAARHPAAPGRLTPPEPGRDVLHLEVVDLPVASADRTGPQSARALRRAALELLHAAHLVLAVVPAAELGGDVAPSPAVAVLSRLLDRVRRAPHPPAVVLVATVAGLSGPDGLADLGSWLRRRGGRTLGSAAEGLPVRALALAEAGRAVGLLDGSARRAGYAVRQAEADCAASGLTVLCDDVLRPLIQEAPSRVPELTAQRVRAACRDIRLDCLDLTARQEHAAALTVMPPAGQAAVSGVARPRGGARAGTAAVAAGVHQERDGRELWDRLEALAVSALAERTVRRSVAEGAEPRGD
ncbi:hypothetical protein ACIRU3_30930 [Streptomyces sp. NPDC101151]|uniref:hypothetical protein n=1 Tax=Streptomyces sp. NPDC101151 TaxID=3366115 RepID=UPI00381576F7